MSLEYISFPPTSGNSPEGLLILLHGWGANAEDLRNLSSMINLPDYQIICPTAPFAHPQVPLGKAWYALETDNYTGLSESRVMLKDWLQSLEAITNVPLQKTILGGFSQGGAMTLDVGLGLPLAGLCVLSGYLHSSPELGDPTPPVLIVHGQHDQVVSLAAAQSTRDELRKLGVNVEYHELSMGHEIVIKVLYLMQNFIKARM